MELVIESQPSVNTSELIDSLGRFRRWTLPSGAMRELLRRGPEIAPTLLRHLSNALAPGESGLEPHAEEAFFCFHLLGGSQAACRDFIGHLLRSGEEVIDRCVGEVTEPYIRALITSLADRDDLASFCDWIDSLVQDDQVNPFGKAQAVDAFLNLVGEGTLQDAEAIHWIRKWLTDRKEIREDLVSSMIVADLIDVGGKDLRELAIECFYRNQIEEEYVDIGCLDKMPDDRRVDFLRERAEADRQVLSDPVSYLQTWHGFAWTTDSLDPLAATYGPIATSRGWQDTPPYAKPVDQWLAEIDRSSYEYYPSDAIEESCLYAEHAIAQLEDRVQRGIDWARKGESFSSNAPYLAALILAQRCGDRSIMMTDPDLFLGILDLTSEQRSEWFGDSIDLHLVEALSLVLAGKTEPIAQRISETSRCEIDRASLVNFFPVSVYDGYLSRKRCLEILSEKWESCLQENEQDDAGCRMLLGAIYDAFCMLSVADDAPAMRQAEEAGVGNLFMSAEVAATFRSEPSKARDLMKATVLGPASLEDAIKSGVQFESNAINPPETTRTSLQRSKQSDLPFESHGTIRSDAQKVGRNAPCTCGSGKKFKKCCGKK